MTFVPINIVNGTTPANATWGNNAQTQYTEAIFSYNQDLFSTGFVLTGLFCTKDGSINNQLDYTTGVYYALQTDGTTRRQSLSASHFTTSVASTTYYFDANPDGTTSFATSHSGQANYVPICQLTTDGSGNILVVTDTRNRTPIFFPTLLGTAGDTGGALAFGVTTKWGATPSLSIDQLGSGVGTAVAQPAAPTVALAAGGSMGTGAYQYVVTLMSVNGESQQGATASITTTTGNNTVSMTAIPTGPTGTIGRNIYRTAVGGTVFKLLRTIHDNTTTTFTDTFADGNLISQNPPVHPTLGADVWKSSGGSTVAAIFADGAAQFNSISSLGGQASGGNFGAPVIVAAAVNVAVTVTTLQTILTYTPTAAGLYRVSCSFNANRTGTIQPTVGFAFTGGNSGSNIGTLNMTLPNGPILNGATTVNSNQDYNLTPQTFYASAAGNITCTYQDNGGTPNDHVTFVIERLA